VMAYKDNDRGFTLIELVTVIVVLGILSAFTLSFLDNAVKTYVMVKDQETLYSEGTYKSCIHRIPVSSVYEPHAELAFCDSIGLDSLCYC
jgi:prepilin-type N-terminal cleavage/methylation domain-containing protein